MHPTHSRAYPWSRPRWADHETTPAQFEARVAARKFRKYVCMRRAAGSAIAVGAGGARAADEKEAEAVHTEEVIKM